MCSDGLYSAHHLSFGQQREEERRVSALPERYSSMMRQIGIILINYGTILINDASVPFRNNTCQLRVSARLEQHLFIHCASGLSNNIYQLRVSALRKQNQGHPRDTTQPYLNLTKPNSTKLNPYKCRKHHTVIPKPYHSCHPDSKPN
jgi:hypothetical protein